MTSETPTPVRDPSVPQPYGTVCPWVITRDTAKLAEFLVGDSVILAFDARPHWPETPAFLRIYVPDADATVDRMVQAGGEVVTSLASMPWGDRSGRVRDPLGNLWWVMARMETVSEEELNRRWGQPKWVEAMAHATDFDPFPSK